MPIPRNAPNPASVCLLAERSVLLTLPRCRSACAASRPGLAKLQQLPRTMSPARHPGVTHPLKATTLPEPVPPLALCEVTHSGGLYSLKIKHSPQRGKLVGMPIMTNSADQETEPVSSACILKALTRVFWCVLLTRDIKSSISG